LIIHILSNPISVVKYQGNPNDIIIVNSDFIGVLFEKKFKIQPIVASRYTAFFIYLYFILRSKISRETKFHVYHEGNNYLFDILWLLLKPVVYRTEYYGLKAFTRLSKDEIKFSKFFKVLRCLRLCECFEYFKSFDDEGSPDIIWFRVRDEYVTESINPSVTSCNEQAAAQRSAIVLIGRDVAADDKLVEILDETIGCLHVLGFSVALKNHPNPAFELSYQVPTKFAKVVTNIDPLSLAEDYTSSFNVALGFGSTGILSFNQPISLYGFLTKSIEVKERIKHLNNTAEMFQSKVYFPGNKEELERYLCQ
jgi:hypothetical protein